MSWDTSFSTQPFNFNFPVFDFVTFDDGTGPALYAAADSNLFRWDGTSWTFVLGADDSISSLAVYDDGSGPQLYMAGDFTTCANVPASAIAKWDGGLVVSGVGGGVHGNGGVQQVQDLLVHDDGAGSRLYVCGYFTSAGTSGALTQSRGIVSWNGTSWTGYGGGVDANPSWAIVMCVAFYDDGGGDKLHVGGIFDTAGGVQVNGMAKWTGFRWAQVGSVTLGPGTMITYDDGNGPALYASNIQPTGQSRIGVARWDGQTWSALGGDISGGSAFAEDLVGFDDGNGSALYAAGLFWSAGGVPATRIARWDGTSWSALGSGLNDDVLSLAVHDDGSGPSLFAGGYFTRAGEIPSIWVARWRGCAGPVDSICFGDGTVAACPCGNQGLFGRGCQNSNSTGGALLQASGTTAPDTLVLTSSGELPHAFSIFLQGDAVIGGGASFGDGLRCTGGHLRRLYLRTAVSGSATAPEPGEPSITQRSAEKGDPIGPGSTRYYQVYYRDPDPTFCSAPTGGTFNASSGIRVTW